MYKYKDIELRAFNKEDAEKYLEWANDPQIASPVDRVLPVSKYEHGTWYEDLMNNKNAVVFAIVAKPNNYIGNVWLWDIDWRHRKAEVRILIGDKKYHNKGLGTQSIEAVTDFAFSKLGLHKMYAYILGNNNVASKAFLRAGFRLEGTLKKDRFMEGQFVDTFLVAKINE